MCLVLCFMFAPCACLPLSDGYEPPWGCSNHVEIKPVSFAKAVSVLNLWEIMQFMTLEFKNSLVRSTSAGNKCFLWKKKKKKSGPWTSAILGKSSHMTVPSVLWESHVLIAIFTEGCQVFLVSCFCLLSYSSLDKLNYKKNLQWSLMI